MTSIERKKEGKRDRDRKRNRDRERQTEKERLREIYREKPREGGGRKEVRKGKESRNRI